MMTSLNLYRLSDFPGVVFIQHSLPESDRVLDRILYLGLALEPVAIGVYMGEDSCNYAIAQRALDLNFPWILKRLQASEPDTWKLQDGVIFGENSELSQTTAFDLVSQAKTIASAKLG